MKRLATLFSILLLLSLLLCSCRDITPGKEKEEKIPTNENITYILDGRKVEFVPTDKKAVAFVRPNVYGETRGVWDYEINDLKEGTPNQTVYLQSVDLLFESHLDALKHLDELDEGSIVGTMSYFAFYEQGGAVYKVVKTDKEKTLKTVPFEIDGEKVVTVEMYGANALDDVGDQDCINSAFEDKDVSYVEFEKKEYLQTGRIYITRSDLTVDGCGAKICNRYDYILKSDGQLLPRPKTDKSKDFVNFESTNGTDFQISGSAIGYLKNITIKNLTLYCSEMRGVGSLYNRIEEGIHKQMSASYVENFTVSGCSFIVPERTGIGTGIVDGGGENVEKEGEIITFNNDCLSIGNGARNVLIENNTMINLCGGGAGCTLDIAWGYHYDYVIRNNYIDKNCHDEIFVIYGTSMFDGADIYGNTFKSHDEPGNGSAHPLGFNANGIMGYIKNIKFHDNIMDAVSSFDGINFGHCENIEIYDNDLQIHTNNRYINLLYGFFRVPNEDTVQKNIYIHDNKVMAINYSKNVPFNYNCDESEGIFRFENNEYTVEYYNGGIK